MKPNQRSSASEYEGNLRNWGFLRGSRLMVASLVIVAAAVLEAQRRDAFIASRDHASIQYSSAPTTDRVAQLNEQLQRGKASLRFEPTSGYLESVLQALGVPRESQTLVFSPTSFQSDRISVQNPRAVYFTDTVLVGWVRGGELLEVAAQDPKQGVVFYALDQRQSDTPQFRRDNQCLACHLSWDTLGVPGLMVGSMAPLPDDKYAYATGFNTVQGSPLDQRWGGWFVTGRHGGARHMGNIPVMPADKGKLKLTNPRAPLPNVQGLFDVSGFPTAHSDVVALMVLAHQARMTNLITRTGWEARVAESAPSADASARVREAAAELVDYLLFVDEADLVGPVQGASGFAEAFAAGGPRDSQGRSLRQFDLRTRLFKYPCSYMIYTEAFDALPTLARDAVVSRMMTILTGKEKAPKYAVLTAADRRAILEILRETKKGLLPEA
jgi:hypothetical protein